MSRTAIVVALVATFLAGASLGLMGGIGVMFVLHRPPGPGLWMHGPRAGEPFARGLRRPPTPEAMLPRLRDALDLSDAQVALIRPVLEDAHRTMGATRDSLRARIDRVLSPEQRQRWRRLESRHGFPGEPRGPLDRAHRALPGPEGEER